MTTWDKIVARLMEAMEKTTARLANCWAWAENKGRRISLMAQQREKQKELDRAYARLGRLIYEGNGREPADTEPMHDIQEARQAVAALRKELEELESLIGAHK
jgi:hypothetical protein